MEKKFETNKLSHFLTPVEAIPVWRLHLPALQYITCTKIMNIVLESNYHYEF